MSFLCSSESQKAAKQSSTPDLFPVEGKSELLIAVFVFTRLLGYMYILNTSVRLIYLLIYVLKKNSSVFFIRWRIVLPGYKNWAADIYPLLKVSRGIGEFFSLCYFWVSSPFFVEQALLEYMGRFTLNISVLPFRLPKLASKITAFWFFAR